MKTTHTYMPASSPPAESAYERTLRAARETRRALALTHARLASGGCMAMWDQEYQQCNR